MSAYDAYELKLSIYMATDIYIFFPFSFILPNIFHDYSFTLKMCCYYVQVKLLTFASITILLVFFCSTFLIINVSLQTYPYTSEMTF